jgi:predicted DNA-binding protein (UPF0251 family)
VYFKPRGVPLRTLTDVRLGLDEVEALRLADLEGLSQEEVGRQMNVSRATVGRILEQARRKVADALTTGKALRIEGGPALLDGLSNRQGRKDMPNRDGTGPEGQGPGTGRGAGGCVDGAREADDDTPRRGRGRGRGRRRGGQGCGHGHGRGGKKGGNRD